MSFTFPHAEQARPLNNAPNDRFLKRSGARRVLRTMGVLSALSTAFISACAAARHGGGGPAAGVSERATRAVTDSLRAVLNRALTDSAFPGAYAVVGTRDGVIAEYGVGRLDVADATRPTARTVWDLASLTKVIGTTSAMLQLVGSGRVALDSPVVKYLPEWTAPRANRITVRQLLAHNSGLPAWRALYKESATPAEAATQLFATSPDTVPGVRFLYSDLGFILLGKLVERVSGEPLAQYDTSHIFVPLGMRDTRYLPPSDWLSRIAPTEQDSWRGRKLRGEVHDENASRLGGVSGHAGLFSSARDLTRFARMYLHYGTLDGVRVFDSATVALFTRVQDTTVSRRALGWETPTGRNSAGRRMPAVAFGHTGFTGTSLWMDPSRGVFVLLLTNRVNPTRNNTRINGVRISLADAVVSAMEDTGVGNSRGAGR
jgi:CubicO group peptidase (beta-lactamase class C family)